MTSRRRDDHDDASPDGWLGALYDRHADSLYRYAVMILADRAAAGDAVHQVFLGVARQPAGHVQCDERYLRRAVRNECYGLLRRRRDGAVGEGLLEAVAAADERPDERLAVEAAMRTLPAEQREVLHLKVFEGFTFQEIAAQLGESINTVASRYRYAIEKLRALLGSGET
jgi:RNA polymerase sigma-70 factor (ECF subfamily)